MALTLFPMAAHAQGTNHIINKPSEWSSIASQIRTGDTIELNCDVGEEGEKFNIPPNITELTIIGSQHSIREYLSASELLTFTLDNISLNLLTFHGIGQNQLIVSGSVGARAITNASLEGCALDISGTGMLHGNIIYLPDDSLSISGGTVNLDSSMPMVVVHSLAVTGSASVHIQAGSIEHSPIDIGLGGFTVDTTGTVCIIRNPSSSAPGEDDVLTAISGDITVKSGTFTTTGEGSLDGSLTVNGTRATVSIDGDVTGDLIVSGGMVTISGTVDGAVRITGGTLMVNGKLISVQVSFAMIAAGAVLAAALVLFVIYRLVIRRRRVKAPEYTNAGTNGGDHV